MKHFSKIIILKLRFYLSKIYYNWKFKLSSSIALTLISISFLYQNCGEVSVSPSVKSSKANLSEEICIRGPANNDPPQKIIFYLDHTESMGGIDPARVSPLKKARRVEALSELINYYKTKENFYISFGFIRDQSGGFINHTSGNSGGISPLSGSSCPTQLFYQPYKADDFSKITQILETQTYLSQNTSGSTKFKAFFESAKTCVLEDLKIHPDSIYNIVLVTDGQDNSSTLQDLQKEVQNLVISGKKSDEEYSHVNLFFYLINSDPDLFTYLSILEKEAKKNGGILSSVHTYSKSDLTDLSYLEIKLYNRLKYRIQRFYALNLNAAVSDISGEIQADSDGDGITDIDETNPPYKRPLTDPRMFSSSFFSDYPKSTEDLHLQCSDKVFSKRGACPSSCQAVSALSDVDHDGASNCDENSEYSSDDIEMDSDEDGIPDGLEVRIGSNPIEKDSQLDQSGDGIDNYHKALSQIGSKFNNKIVHHRFLTKTDFIYTRELDGLNCYLLRVLDLPLFPTLSVLGENHDSNTLDYLRHDTGGNIIQLYIYLIPDNNPNGRPLLLYNPKPKLVYYQDEGDTLQNQIHITEKDLTLYEK